MKTNDQIIKEITTYKNLRPKSVQNIKTVTQQYTTLHNKNLAELIEEAEQEEQQGLKKHQKKLTQRLLRYREHLEERGLQPSTIHTKLAIIESIYRYHEIQTPHIQTREARRTNETIHDIPNHEQITRAIKTSKHAKMRALITLISSSGITVKDILHLTVADFIEATQEYHHGGRITDILTTLSERNDVIPTWDITRIKTNTPYITFNTPECTEYTLEHLWEQYRKHGLSMNTPLFGSSESTIVHSFSRLNDKLGYGYNKKGTQRFFHSHSLRKYFINTLHDMGVDMLTVEFMVGHRIAQVQDAYYRVNPERMKEKYRTALPGLQFLNRVVVRELDSDERRRLVQLEHELDEYKREMRRVEELLGKLSI